MEDWKWKHVLVWTDRWILGTQTRKIISPYIVSTEHLLVSDLLLPNSADWNLDMLNALFLPFERDRILSIPLSEKRPYDVLCWDLEKNSIYSVKSAYKQIFGGDGDY